ncbi:serine/threonine-protein kinase [Nonomuraea sp. NBC_01738]|uniref:serine/threonine-protein kinase n=1 Tax=Nonomuraea sp. NBC_01738 TaxID=2976003 RepID=UPI002E11772E|nr:serine/threonine-protein kinase [Nonomuraea sp. NBC_01738]
MSEGDPEWIGPYRLAGILGEGGQGVVYLGEGGSGERVAVKVAQARAGRDPEVRRLFEKEVAAARKVAPFCTARVLDSGLFEERPYIVSEYVPGKSLHALVASEGPRSGGGLQRLAIATLNALESIHRAGVVHRDLKPANVIMGPEGPVVIDFGIAKALDQATTRSGLVGTPAYMAPEVFEGRPAGPASDVFGWAATLVYAATGRNAFRGDTMSSVMKAIMVKEPELAGVPAEFLPMLTACLAKDPAARPTVGFMLTDLTSRNGDAAPPTGGPVAAGGTRVPEDAVTHTVTPTVAEPPAVPAPAVVGARKRRGWVVAVSGVVGAAVVAGAGVALTRGVTTGGAPKAGVTSAAPTLRQGPPLSGVKATKVGEFEQNNYIDEVDLSTVDGKPVAVSLDWGGGIVVWDVNTGKVVGKPFTRATGQPAASSMDTTVFNGRPVAVTADVTGTIWISDLATGKQVGPPIIGPKASAQDLQVITLNGALTAVYLAGRSVGLADLAKGTVRTVGPEGLISLAVGELDGHPIAVGGHLENSVHVIDLVTGQAIGSPRPGHKQYVRSAGAGQINGYAYAITADNDDEWRVWDLSRPGPALVLRGNGRFNKDFWVGTLRDRLVIVGSTSRGAQVWDPATGIRIAKLPGVDGDELDVATIGGTTYVVDDHLKHVRVFKLT